MMTQKRVYIAKKTDLQSNRPLSVDVEGVSVVIIEIADQYYAFENQCPHRTYPLSDGYLQDGAIVCPLHGRKYDLQTGGCLRPVGADSLNTYEVFEEGNDLYIDLDDE